MSYMRSFITSLLLFSIMLPTISPWGTIAYFHLNRDYIAKVLCENRDKPQLLCNGTCYLAKKLREQREKEDQKTMERVQNYPILQLFSNPVFTFDFYSGNTFDDTLKLIFQYDLHRYTSPSFGILRPPKGF